VFENKVLKRMFESKRDEVKGNEDSFIIRRFIHVAKNEEAEN